MRRKVGLENLALSFNASMMSTRSMILVLDVSSHVTKAKICFIFVLVTKIVVRHTAQIALRSQYSLNGNHRKS